MELNVTVANPKSHKQARLESLPEQEGKSDDTIIANTAPLRSKISISHSKILSRLPSRATNSLLVVSQREKKKVLVRFKSIGSISQLQPTVFKISRDSRFISILKFLQKRLKLKQVYCYLENSIVPNPDDSIGSLFDLFKSGNNELIVSYCNMVAFG